jgi:hypothetical protein
MSRRPRSRYPGLRLTAELLGEVIEELEVYRARAERIGVEPS